MMVNDANMISMNAKARHVCIKAYAYKLKSINIGAIAIPLAIKVYIANMKSTNAQAHLVFMANVKT